MPGGRTLDDADLRARDRLILEARSQGTTWPQIAARFSLSESAARRAAARAAKLAAEQGLADIDAGALVEQIVRTEARALYRLDELVHDANSSVAVGACRAVGVVGHDLRRSLAAAGLIPESGDGIRYRRELQKGVEALIAAADQVGVPLAEVHAALQEQPALARVRP